MKKNRFFRSLTFPGLILVAAGVLSFSECLAATQDRKTILSLDLSNNNSLVVLDKYSSSEDTLDGFAVRQKLLSLSLKKMQALYGQTQNQSALSGINTLLSTLISKTEQTDLYTLNEEIYINNRPVTTGSPFYNASGKNPKIEEMKTYPEYIYLDNLKLEYKKNALVSNDDELWLNPRGGADNGKPKNQGTALPEEKPELYLAGDTAKAAWSYRAADEHLNDFFYDARQWIKRYEEELIFPAVYQNAVVLRNEYRIFCLDLLTGKELWSFSRDTEGRERYQTFRHPHQNSYGHELLLSNGTVFTELAGELIAVDLKNILSPQLIWKRNLGEYTVCTKPLLHADTLVVGLINARGEFWICGFDPRSGTSRWDTYIGTTSFLSPVCAISNADDQRVFIGTNLGLLTCLDPRNGEIAWLKKYSPRKYSLFDYVKKGYYKDKILDKGTLAYDTQFIENGGELLYYKPRESDYLYVLDRKNGQEKEKILIDSDRFYLLSVLSGKAVLLEKQTDKEKPAELRIIDLESGTQKYSRKVKSGPLKGVVSPQANELLFASGQNTIRLEINGGEIKHAEINLAQKGWLLGKHEGFLFMGENKELSCFAVNTRRNPSEEIVPYKEYLEHRDAVVKDFTEAAPSETNNIRASELRLRLLSQIKTANVQMEELMPVIINNLERLKQPEWKDLFPILENRYGEQIVACRDVNLKLKGFLNGSGLTRNQPKKITNKNAAVNPAGFRVTGSNLIPIPVKTIHTAQPDFFLLLKNDQLLCLDENGNILWARKIFFLPGWYGFMREDKGQHLYSRNNVKAYLYDNVLVINDQINIIGISAEDGTYLWSMTNAGEDYAQEKLLPPSTQDPLLLRYGASRSYVEHIMYYAEFLEDRIVIVHGNKIYSVDPLTGYCAERRELSMAGVIAVAAKDNRVYVVSSAFEKISVFDKKLEILKDIPLDFIEKNTLKWPELSFTKKQLLLNLNPVLYIIDTEKGRLMYQFAYGNDRCNIETHNDSVLIITPFQKISSYRIEESSLGLNWEFALGEQPQGFLLAGITKYDQDSFIVDNSIISPFKEKDNFALVSLDIKTGKELWRNTLPGVKGTAKNISDFVNLDGEIKFIISAGCDVPAAEKNACTGSPAADIKSVLFGVKAESGKITQAQTLPSFMEFPDVKTAFAIGRTTQCLIYGVNGSIATSCKKKK